MLKRSEVRRLHVFDLELVRHHQHGQEWVPHWHNEWSFGAVAQGTCQCSIAGRPLTVRAGDLIAIAPGAVHTGAIAAAAPSDGVAVMMLYAPPSWLMRTGLELPSRSTKVTSPVLVRQAETLASAESAQAWLQHALPLLTEASDKPAGIKTDPTPSDSVRALLARVQIAMLRGEQTVAGLARHCAVSRERLHRVVSQWLGMSPVEYLRAVRIHRAKQLLLNGASVAAVASDCGFSDQAHFTRWFRRVFGYTPGDLIASAEKRTTTQFPP